MNIKFHYIYSMTQRNLLKILFPSFLFLFLFVNVNQTKSQNLYFYMNDATVQIYPIADVQRMDFDSSAINLHLTNQSIISIQLSTLSYYRYTPDIITSNRYIDNYPQLNCFPNPAENQLNLQFVLPNTSSAMWCYIYNLKGEKLLEKEAKLGTSGELKIDISMLETGQYICSLLSDKLVISKAFIKK